MYLLFCSNFRNMFTWNIHDDCIFVFIWFGIIYNLIQWSFFLFYLYYNALSEKETCLLRICPKFRYLFLSYFLLWRSLLMTNVKILINDTHIYKSLLLEVIEDSVYSLIPCSSFIFGKPFNFHLWGRGRCIQCYTP